MRLFVAALTARLIATLLRPCADICMKRGTFETNILTRFRLLFLSNNGVGSLKQHGHCVLMCMHASEGNLYLLILHHVHYDPV